MSFTIGCDPELFIENEKKECVPIFNYSTGTKTDPEKTSFGALQVDGMALEYNINPLVLTRNNAEEFVNKNYEAKDFITSRIPNGYKISRKASFTFSQDVFEKVPEHCKILGCDPDYNAYTLSVNERPDPEKLGKATFRTAGGHIHIGWLGDGEKPFDVNDQGHFLDCAIVTKLLDQLLYTSFSRLDPDKERIKLYGGPGVFRPKPYGVEYRSLSNNWTFSKRKILTVFNRLTQLEGFLNHSKYLIQKIEKLSEFKNLAVFTTF